jgi:Ricin-type beta-trefoil lectin domain.
MQQPSEDYAQYDADQRRIAAQKAAADAAAAAAAAAQKNAPKPAPAPVPAPKPPQVATLGAGRIVNKDGGLCIDAEGGAGLGARVIAYACSGNANQQITIDGRIRIGGYCAQADTRNKGSEIHLKACDSKNDSLQGFGWWVSNEGRGACTSTSPCIGHNTGNVLAAASSFFGNRPLCLWVEYSRSDAHWKNGQMVSFQPGQPVVFQPSVTELRVAGKAGVSTVKHGMITSDGLGLLGHDGGGIVGNNGNGVVGTAGGSIVGNNGNGLVASSN